jgi:peptidoglycan/LPS O-acetylase OafA/YrhL
MKSTGYIYSHTGLRGIAAFSVFMFHLTCDLNRTWGIPVCFLMPFEWPGAAVDLFFVLSGFILHSVYVRPGNHIDWHAYAVARIARIFPLYYITTFMALIVPAYNHLHRGMKFFSPKELLLNLFMVSGILHGYHSTINYPAWSISVEVFCYLLIFPLLVLLIRFANRFLLLFLLFFCIAGLMMVNKHEDTIAVFHVHWHFRYLLSGVFGFSVGYILSSIRTMNEPSATRIILGVFQIAAILTIPALVITRNETSLIPFLALLVFASSQDDLAFFQFLKHPFFQWLGDRSYSIYLWHIPIIALVTLIVSSMIYHFTGSYSDTVAVFLITIASVLVVSHYSYVYLETPLRGRIRNLLAKTK